MSTDLKTTTEPQATETPQGSWLVLTYADDTYELFEAPGEVWIDIPTNSGPTRRAMDHLGVVTAEWSEGDQPTPKGKSVAEAEAEAAAKAAEPEPEPATSSKK